MHSLFIVIYFIPLGSINFRRCPIIKELEINEEIRDREVRLIDMDGTQLGVISGKKALEIAMQKRLDLVKIAPQAKPPVCKIMDYGKYKFEQSKKEKEAKKKQKVINVKEVRLSLNIEQHDLGVKANNAIKFLSKGDKVKVTLRFKGREMGYSKLGYDVMDKFAQLISEVGTVEKKPNLEGRNMTMFLAPKNA
ncbi:translation initiation factor IF-3 [Crassaminicella indica]|uniref:Translation initiation factor IF-3 n=1 Tax=Crassaminicella indica TaxID=2855394 RepID=A0ABX8RC30_9CLOT|nr:translation initiation factor IF-3 [Crassaminicella indica]